MSIHQFNTVVDNHLVLENTPNISHAPETSNVLNNANNQTNIVSGLCARKVFEMHNREYVELSSDGQYKGMELQHTTRVTADA